MASLIRIASNGNTSSLFHPRETLISTTTLAGTGQFGDLLCDGCSTVSLDIRGTFVGTLEVVGSVDGVTFSGPIPMRTVNAGHIYIATQTTVGMSIGACAGFRLLRVRVVGAWTSGSATVTLQSHLGVIESIFPQAQQVTTVLGAVGVATTLTIAAAPTSMRHYITCINISRFATALLTAGTVPVNITTTNLPNALAFSAPAEAAAAGSMFLLDQDYSLPIQTTAQATATTFVAPATAGVIWRLSCGFFTAP